MNQLFSIDASCNQYILDLYLNDARTMLSSARTAITNLQGTRTFRPGSKTRHLCEM